MQATTQQAGRPASESVDCNFGCGIRRPFAQIVKTASQFYGKLTENRYTEIELTPTTLRVKRADGDWRAWDNCHGDGRQPDFAVKLARRVMAQQVAMPVVIDDGFVNFDANRRQAATLTGNHQ